MSLFSSSLFVYRGGLGDDDATAADDDDDKNGDNVSIRTKEII